LADYGSLLITVDDENKVEAGSIAKRFADIGYRLVATKGTAAYLRELGLKVHEVGKIHEDAQTNMLDLIRMNKVEIVINTMGKDRDVATDGFAIRREAVEHGVPLFTSLDTAAAIVRVLESRSFSTKAL